MKHQRIIVCGSPDDPSLILHRLELIEEGYDVEIREDFKPNKKPICEVPIFGKGYGHIETKFDEPRPSPIYTPKRGKRKKK